MGKLILLVLIIATLCIIYKLVRVKDKREEKSKKSFEEEASINELIEHFEMKIKKAEINIQNGVDIAQTNLEYYKKELERCKEIKNKINLS